MEFVFDLLPGQSVRIEYNEKIMAACKISGLSCPSAVVKATKIHGEGYNNSFGVDDTAECILMPSICLTFIEVEGVEVLEGSY